MDPSDLRAGLAEKLAKAETIDAQTFNAVCFMLSRALEEIEFSVLGAAPLVRRLLRVAGRVVIDTGLPESAPGTWSSTEAMALEWVDEALHELGYCVRPLPEGGRPELAKPDHDW